VPADALKRKARKGRVPSYFGLFDFMVYMPSVKAPKRLPLTDLKMKRRGVDGF